MYRPSKDRNSSNKQDVKFAKLPDAKKIPNDFNWPKRPPVVRVIRGTRFRKPIGHPDMLAQISKNTTNQGTTNTEAFKSYDSSVYRPRGRPIWADRLITSIGSGHWYLPHLHTSSISTEYRPKYITEADVAEQFRLRDQFTKNFGKKKNSNTEMCKEDKEPTHKPTQKPPTQVRIKK